MAAMEPRDSEASPRRAAKARRQQRCALSERGGTVVTCTICQEETTLAACSEAKACGHTFHGICIRKWAKKSSQCPVCRTEMGSLVTAYGGSGQPRRGGPKVEVLQERRPPPGGGEMDAAEERFLSRCEVCRSTDTQFEDLVRCGRCLGSYHASCLHNAAGAVPLPGSTWHCPCCAEELARLGLLRGRLLGRVAYLGPGAAYEKDAGTLVPSGESENDEPLPRRRRVQGAWDGVATLGRRRRLRRVASGSEREE